jgi:hypothetical protein
MCQNGSVKNQVHSIKALEIGINWHSGLSIFASEPFLRAVGDEYGWLGGIDDRGRLRCILPYTLIRKAGFRMVRFRVETIPVGEGIDESEEKSFLNSVVDHCRSLRADVIIPATNNTIFRTFPDGADAAPYGSYIIDLCQSEDELWRNINGKTRQNINGALRAGVCVRSGSEYLEPAYSLISATFKRSNIRFMDFEAFKRFIDGLGSYGKILVADFMGAIHSCAVYGFSSYCTYAIYGGSIANQHQGATKLIHWDAIRLFKGLGIQLLDFVGARIDPEKGSKQETINLFKQHLGAKLRQGYIWKYPLRPLGSLAYSTGVRVLRGGDLVDKERHKLPFHSESRPR